MGSSCRVDLAGVRGGRRRGERSGEEGRGEEGKRRGEERRGRGEEGKRRREERRGRGEEGKRRGEERRGREGERRGGEELIPHNLQSLCMNIPGKESVERLEQQVETEATLRIQYPTATSIHHAIILCQLILQTQRGSGVKSQGSTCITNSLGNSHVFYPSCHIEMSSDQPSSSPDQLYDSPQLLQL